MAVVGYLLSPLSWWNDLFVNIPLAYVFASAVGLVIHGYFLASMVVGYWITNIAGLIMMHAGIQVAALKEKKIDLMKYLIISLLYTALVCILCYIGFVRFPADYHL